VTIMCGDDNGDDNVGDTLDDIVDDECSLELAEAAGQQERKSVAELQTELVGFKDRIRVAEGELAKNAPLIAQLNHANQNMGNRVGAIGFSKHVFCIVRVFCSGSACWSRLCTCTSCSMSVRVCPIIHRFWQSSRVMKRRQTCHVLCMCMCLYDCELGSGATCSRATSNDKPLG